MNIRRNYAGGDLDGRLLTSIWSILSHWQNNRDPLYRASSKRTSTACKQYCSWTWSTISMRHDARFVLWSQLWIYNDRNKRCICCRPVAFTYVLLSSTVNWSIRALVLRKIQICSYRAQLFLVAHECFWSACNRMRSRMVSHANKQFLQNWAPFVFHFSVSSRLSRHAFDNC